MNYTLTATQLQDILGEVMYMPGWTALIYETEAQGLWIAFDAEVEDAFNPGSKVPLRIKSPLPPFENRHEFLRWLRWRLERIAIHEVHEFLRWKATKKPIWDPHADGADEPLLGIGKLTTERGNDAQPDPGVG